MRRNKYNAQPTVYNGVRYDSKAEAKYAESLDLLLENGDIDWWLRQVTIALGVPENKYRVDFVVRCSMNRSGHDDVGVWAVDVKGVETATFRRNARLWARYGPFDLKIVKGGKVDRIIPGGGQE